jgi:hypothetical protein
MKPTVYLVGSITGLLYDAATNWRNIATRLLAPEIEVRNPMRGCRYLDDGTPIPAVQVQHTGIVMSTNKGIYTRDKRDCITSDAILMYFPDGAGASIGSSIEIGWADAFQIPIIGVASKDNVHRAHPMSEVACLWCDTLEQGCQVIRSILNREI